MAVSFTEYMVALRSSGLAGPTRSLALWIAARCANDWAVTRETIVGDSGFSRATVARAIEHLETTRWLKRTSSRKGNRYELMIPEQPEGLTESPLQENDRITESLQRAQSEPTEGLTESPLRENDGLTENLLRAHSEPTKGSQRAYAWAHSEPIYIRTKQEPKNNKNPALARTPAYAREDDPSTISHSNTNQTLLWTWVKALLTSPKGKAEVSKEKHYVRADGSIYTEMVVTDLMTSERMFERFRPLFVQLRAEGRI